MRAGAGGMALGSILTITGAEPTIITLSADWASEVDHTGDKTFYTDRDPTGSDEGFILRYGCKWDITSLPASATVTKVELIINVLGVTSAGALLWDIDGYNGTGLDDPEADSGATMYTRCAITGVYVNDTTEFRTTGIKTLELGATANSDVEAARDAGVIYSVAIKETVESAGSTHSDFTQHTDGTNPPKLRITYT